MGSLSMVGKGEKMTQITLNLEQGRYLRDRGIELASMRNQTFLETVRSAARMICREKGTVTCDDVRKWASDNNIEPTTPNGWGALFKSPEFVSVGYTQSAQVQRHGGILRVWKLK